MCSVGRLPAITALTLGCLTPRSAAMSITLIPCRINSALISFGVIMRTQVTRGANKCQQKRKRTEHVWQQMETYSQRLQHVASVKKIDQKDLVVGIKKARSTVSKWWNGGVVPSRTNNRLIAKFLRCDERWLETGSGEPFPETEKISQIKQELSGNGNNIALKDVGQINQSSFAEKGKKYHTLGTSEVENIVQQLKELKQLKKWKAEQEQRTTAKNFNLQLIVEWMDEQYAGENQAQTINFLQTMMDLFPSFKAFVDKKTNRTE